MSPWTLVYTSIATRSMSTADLTELLQSAKFNNEKLDVTGILLYRNKQFMQALEGEKGAVTALYRKISGDYRHRAARIVYQHQIAERKFDSWSMGFKNLDTVSRDQLEGFTDFLDQPLTSTASVDSPDRVALFLNLFRL